MEWARREGAERQKVERRRVGSGQFNLGKIGNGLFLSDSDRVMVLVGDIVAGG